MTAPHDPTRWQRLQAAFDAVIELSGEGRATYLAQLASQDAALAEELASLLANADRNTDAVAAVVGRAADEAIEVRDRGTLSQGAAIGAYRIIRLLGRGGMGEVYEAEQTTPVRRHVALKIVSAGASDPQVLARFDAERQSLALMDHPAIATVHDAGESEGRPYFVMELVDGVPIDTFCDRENLNLRARIALVAQICRGVQHAHVKGVIHRDLKPSNILVALRDGRPEPKVIDFGVAKAAATPLFDATQVTRVGQVIGTPRYMSPEQLGSMGIDVDTRSDIYALGTVLYELLVGEHPLDATALSLPGGEAYRRQLLEVEPVAPSRRLRTSNQAQDIAQRRSTTTLGLSGTLRGDLDWILLKCLEKDRDRRYPSAGELADDLERYLRDEPVAAGPPTFSYRARKFVRRNRVASLAAVLVLASLLMGLAIAWSGLVRARTAESAALAQAATANEVSEFLVGLFAASDPDRKELANVSARQLLDVGAAQIDARLHDQPQTKARLLITIGRVYESVGLPSNARPILERAVALLDESGGDPLELAHALNSLATVQRRLDDPTAALVSAERSLLIRRETVGELHQLTARSWSVVGISRIRAGDYKGAEVALIKARDIVAATGPGTEEHANAAYNLAGVLYEQGRVRESLPLLKESLAIQESIDPTAARIGDQYSGLGALLFELGDFPASEQALQRALEHRRAVYGNDHYVVSETLGNLAQLKVGMRQFERAASLAREAIATAQRAGPNMLATHTALNHEHLALGLAGLGDFAGARAAANEAIEARRQLPDTHPEAKLGHQALGRVELAAGNLEEARRILEDVRAQREPLLGLEHNDIIMIKADLAQLEARAGNPAGARDRYEQVLSASEQADLLGHPEVQDALRSYVRLLRETGQEGDAKALEVRLDAGGL